MREYVVKEPNKRLDEVVFEHYGSLDMFDFVMAKNTHLTGVELGVDEVVFLPEIIKKQLEELLW